MGFQMLLIGLLGDAEEPCWSLQVWSFDQKRFSLAAGKQGDLCVGWKESPFNHHSQPQMHYHLHCHLPYGLLSQSNSGDDLPLQNQWENRFCVDRCHHPQESAVRDSQLKIRFVVTFNPNQENTSKITVKAQIIHEGPEFLALCCQTVSIIQTIDWCQEKCESDSDSGVLCDKTNDLWNRVLMYNSESN